jgi:hypothetical protein
MANRKIFAQQHFHKKSRAKKTSRSVTAEEAKIQAEHYEEELLGGITPGGS